MGSQRNDTRTLGPHSSCLENGDHPVSQDSSVLRKKLSPSRKFPRKETVSGAKDSKQHQKKTHFGKCSTIVGIKTEAAVVERIHGPIVWNVFHDRYFKPQEVNLSVMFPYIHSQRARGPGMPRTPRGCQRWPLACIYIYRWQ